MKLYVIGEPAGPVKIGIANSVLMRLRDLQSILVKSLRKDDDLQPMKKGKKK
jgi:hypothetical protein